MLKRILNLEGAEELTANEQKTIFGEAQCEGSNSNGTVQAGKHYATNDGDRQCTNK